MSADARKPLFLKHTFAVRPHTAATAVSQLFYPEATAANGHFPQENALSVLQARAHELWNRSKGLL
jgi:hypothetical protein